MDPSTDPYNELLLRHSRNPKGFGPLEQATHAADGLNPLCGDHVHIDLVQTGNTIAAAAFQGRSCAICTASASLLTSAVVGKTPDEVQTLIQDFRSALKGTPPTNLPSNLELLTRVRLFPARVKCAVLPWETLLLALQQPVETQDPARR